MKVLAIDTSNQVMGVAVSDGQTVLGEIATNMKKNHSVRLMPAIESLLKEVHLEQKDLDRVAVAYGPGSYTGVRIGVTVAKTMAWALDIPIVGVSSLEVLAQNGSRFFGRVSPLFDARRGQVYTGLYSIRNGQFDNVKKDRIVQLADWLDQIGKGDEPILFLGQDLDKHGKMIKETLGDQAYFASLGEQNPRPGELALLGSSRSPAKSVHAFTPAYLQLPEAEAKWLASQE
ncbi:MAG TPA: tRNA (adenosine(37)-N6)-threonylcarbamoyltransferase complex dimerization subunit type 1 TsaB [Bacillales bacterium]|nr:tRNA (adenosine(37)-N6)-threonylcarbamoyltransferase complex dimerization subunit type 1 TsaB [Bacillales bacterium]